MSNGIFAYKGFDYEENGYLVCKGSRYKKKYRVGHNHFHRGELVVCKSGMHCCQVLANVFRYKITPAVVCKVVAKDSLGEHPSIIAEKFCCKALYIEKKMTATEIARQLLSDIANKDLTTRDRMRSVDAIVSQFRYKGILKYSKSSRNIKFIVLDELIRMLESMICNKEHRTDFDLQYLTSKIFDTIVDLKYGDLSMRYVIKLANKLEDSDNIMTSIRNYIVVRIAGMDIDAIYSCLYYLVTNKTIQRLLVEELMQRHNNAKSRLKTLKDSPAVLHKDVIDLIEKYMEDKNAKSEVD